MFRHRHVAIHSCFAVLSEIKQTRLSACEVRDGDILHSSGETQNPKLVYTIQMLHDEDVTKVFTFKFFLENGLFS